MWKPRMWWLLNEAGDEGGEGAGGDAGASADEGALDGGAQGAVDQGDGSGGGDPTAGADGKGEAPKDMKTAIDAALGYKPGKDGEAAGGKEKAQSAAGKETDTHHANGKPKKDANGNELDADGKVTKAAGAEKPKTVAELDLKPEERKLLSAAAQARFRDVIGALKSHEVTIAKQTEDIKGLTAARDAILGVMEETHTTQDQLAGYLEFNALLHSSNPKDLEAALGMIEQQRAVLYKALGREPGADASIDLLADFPDLKRQVDDEEITRQAALEIAKGRRERNSRDAQQQLEEQRRRQQSQSAEQAKAAGNKALADIEEWTRELAKSDLDYKAKEDRLLAKLDAVLKDYAPDKWLSTLKLLYEGIEIQKSTASPGGTRPLRPSGARPGAKKPANMEEAISQGLGYGLKG